MSQKPFFVTIPHSGEKIPELTPWLLNLSEPMLMRDVDRFVDVLYRDSIERLDIPLVKTEWHRYAVDLNRLPEDIDQTSVAGAANAKGFERGFHWSVTTFKEKLITNPMSFDTHVKLRNLIYEPFHQQVREKYEQLRVQTQRQTIFHLDLHSMPSLGTSMHLDPGERRADIVISDSNQKSCSRTFRDLVIAGYVTAGFKVAYNWPYKGGRLTEQYGRPQEGQQVLQVEMNRVLYMDEETKRLNGDYQKIAQKLGKALSYIQENL
ncbi:MAG: N-formylglutamate amidohydrolase [Bdellovibrionaceae bacterium]|nr:N-formylglutamate amidohydrolase [Pseudobdellovibrionaceae bacterium]